MKAKIQNVSAMVIFGTIGLFVRYIPLPSGVIAMTRGFVGAAFLLLVTLLCRRKPDGAAIRKNLPLLVLSGVLMGFNWILLFEAYRYTTVATATLCYYLAPTFVTLAAPAVLGEKLTGKKLLCALAALAGMVPVSGILGQGFAVSELRGAALGLGAALLYACVVLGNKKLRDISAQDRTVVQLFVAAAAIVPYVALTGGFSAPVTMPAAILLLTVGIIHTGAAYFLYFGSLSGIPAQTAAIFSYVDPVVAIILSALVLHEPMSWLTALGAALILGAAFLSETGGKKTSAN